MKHNDKEAKGCFDRSGLSVFLYISRLAGLFLRNLTPPSASPPSAPLFGSLVTSRRVDRVSQVYPGFALASGTSSARPAPGNPRRAAPLGSEGRGVPGACGSK